jgi:hypothetical protein
MGEARADQTQSAEHPDTDFSRAFGPEVTSRRLLRSLMRELFESNHCVVAGGRVMTSGGWAQDPTDWGDEERDATSWSGPGPHTRRDFFIAVFGTPLLIATTWLIGYAVAASRPGAPTGDTSFR